VTLQLIEIGLLQTNLHVQLVVCGCSTLGTPFARNLVNFLDLVRRSRLEWRCKRSLSSNCHRQQTRKVQHNDGSIDTYDPELMDQKVAETKKSSMGGDMSSLNYICFFSSSDQQRIQQLHLQLTMICKSYLVALPAKQGQCRENLHIHTVEGPYQMAGACRLQ
jgi:hypothetical protein